MSEILYNDLEVSISNQVICVSGREYQLKEIISIDTVGRTSGGIGAAETTMGISILLSLIAFVKLEILLGLFFTAAGVGVYYSIKKFLPTQYRIIITTSRGTTEVIASTDKNRISQVLSAFSILHIR
jgi:hypothetical protein